MNSKKNSCTMVFVCLHSERDQCVYFLENGNGKCKYLGGKYNITCMSEVAAVNKMTTEINKILE